MHDRVARYLRPPWRFPWSFALWLLRQRLKRAGRRLSKTVTPRPLNVRKKVFHPVYAHLAHDQQALVEHFRTRSNPRFFSLTVPDSPIGSKEPFVDHAWATYVITQAQRARGHVFEYGGLGNIQLGPSVNWLRDPYASQGMQANASHDDLRVTWELSRGHQLVYLGLGYRLTDDESYVDEVAAQMRSWANANPVGLGPNWQSAMEAALRIINWTWALYLCRPSSHITDDTIHLFVGQVLAHREFISQNLERSAISNNHYLANGIGLLHLGLLFPELRLSARWLRTGRRIVFRETLDQTYPDGVSFEGSTAYHGYVLGLLLQTAVLCQQNGQPLPDSFLERLERMLEYVMAYTRPGGSYPRLGDGDDGKLWPFALDTPDSHRSLLTVGASLYHRADFKAASGGWTPEAQLLLGDDGAKAFSELAVEAPALSTSQAFQASGMFVMRTSDLHLLIDCADVGLRGRGGHGHNDCLSFELYAYGRTFLTDSGTYRYAVPMEERNLFRGTAAHNTAMVDGQEMAILSAKGLWRIADDARPTLHLWHSDGEVDVFEGSHSGYLRLPEPVRHHRRILFDKQQGFWVLEDRFSGKGQHQFDIFFHFLPMPVADWEGAPLALATGNPEGANLVVLPLDVDGLRLEVRDGWVSQRYGEKAAAPVACYTLESSVPATVRFCLYPYLPGKEPTPGLVRRQGEALAARGESMYGKRSSALVNA